MNLPLPVAGVLRPGRQVGVHHELVRATRGVPPVPQEVEPRVQVVGEALSRVVGVSLLEGAVVEVQAGGGTVQQLVDGAAHHISRTAGTLARFVAYCHVRIVSL